MKGSSSPTRHFIDESHGPRDKPPLGKKGADFDPATIRPKENLGKPVTKDSKNDLYATRKVQTNPNAEGRLEYQSAIVSKANLGQGTTMNKSAVKKAKKLGAEGDQAGHANAKLLGSPGVVSNVVAQNARINMGNGREMEGVIAQDVHRHGTVKHSTMPLYDDKPGEKLKTRHEEMLFKVETEAGKLIRYGKIDNPFNKATKTTKAPAKPADGA